MDGAPPARRSLLGHGGQAHCECPVPHTSSHPATKSWHQFAPDLLALKHLPPVARTPLASRFVAMSRGVM